MTLYRVKDWDKHFENNKSRERDQCHFVCVPNKQHGLGLLRILSEPDGAGIYGVWHLIVGLLSRQHLPRIGCLTVDGSQDGCPISTADLAMLWRRPEKEIKRALEVLASSKVGWIEITSNDPAECPSSAREVPDECQPCVLEEKERNRREEKRKKEDCSEPPKAADSELTDFVFPTNRRGESWTLSKSKLDEYFESFPAVDVLVEIRNAIQWCRDNPKKRKTAGGMTAFIGRWLAKEQNSGRSAVNNNHKSSRVPTDEDLANYDPHG